MSLFNVFESFEEVDILPPPSIKADPTEAPQGSVPTVQETVIPMEDTAPSVKSEQNDIKPILSQLITQSVNSPGSSDNYTTSVRKRWIMDGVVLRRNPVISRFHLRTPTCAASSSSGIVEVIDVDKDVYETVDSATQEVAVIGPEKEAGPSTASMKEEVRYETVSSSSTPEVTIIKPKQEVGSSTNTIKEESVEIYGNVKLEPVSAENKIKLEALENRDIKVFRGSTLSPESILHRLLLIGLDPFPIPPSIPSSVKNSTVSRDWISFTYGGASQGMYPPIDRTKFTHDYEGFYYLQYDYNPVCPKKPGYPGLQFSCRPGGIGAHPRMKRLMTKMGTGKWRYMGNYETRVSNPLTKEEWLAQGTKFHNFWTDKMAKKSFAIPLRFRIDYRKKHGHSPTEKQMEEAMKNWKDVNIPPEEIHAAFSSGQEQMNVYALQCIGYDEKYARELSEMPKAWKRSGKGNLGTIQTTPNRRTRNPTKSPRKTGANGFTYSLKRKSVRDYAEESEEGDGSEVHGDSEDEYSPLKTRKTPNKRIRIMVRRFPDLDGEDINMEHEKNASGDDEIMEISSDQFYVT